MISHQNDDELNMNYRKYYTLSMESEAVFLSL